MKILFTLQLLRITPLSGSRTWVIVAGLLDCFNESKKAVWVCNRGLKKVCEELSHCPVRSFRTELPPQQGSGVPGLNLVCGF